MAQLKVYHWQDDRTQTRRVCAAASVADLLRLTGYPSRRWLFNLGEYPPHHRDYAMAMEEHHVIFQRRMHGPDTGWTRVH